MLICINPGYRSMRIENGYGIEKYLSPQETKEIIDKGFLPDYKKNNFFERTKAGLYAIILKLTEKHIQW